MTQDIYDKICSNLREEYKDEYLSYRYSTTEYEYSFSHLDNYDQEKHYAFKVTEKVTERTTDYYGTDIGAWDDGTDFNNYIRFIDKNTLKLVETTPELEIGLMECETVFYYYEDAPANKLQELYLEKQGILKNINEFEKVFSKLEYILENEGNIEEDDTALKASVEAEKKELNTKLQAIRATIPDWYDDFKKNKDAFIKDYIKEEKKALKPKQVERD